MKGTLQKIQEDGDDSCIEQVGEHGSDDGNDEEWLDGIAIFITDSAHVGHGIGRSAKTEATSCLPKILIIIIANKNVITTFLHNVNNIGLHRAPYHRNVDSARL